MDMCTLVFMVYITLDLDRVLNYSYPYLEMYYLTTGTLQASTGHRCFSYIVGKGEVNL
jgi:hypothetical protein